MVYALGRCLLARLDPRHVPTLLGRPGGGLPRVAGALACAQWPIVWAHRPGIACDPALPCAPVPGRILSVRLARAGFRPRALYLFTPLLDEAQAPAAELAALYAERWQVEWRYRELKTTLQMDYFDVRSAAMFQKEREVGLLTYCLIRVAMLDAAPTPAAARRLAFAACRRRVRQGWAGARPALARTGAGRARCSAHASAWQPAD